MGQVVTQAELLRLRSDWRTEGKRVVFVSGAFDLLHPGHVRLLEQARGLGDILVVGIQNDASVRAARGNGRPIVPALERAEILAALAAVDFVVEFDRRAPGELVSRLRPDIFATGDEAKADRRVGGSEGEAGGGRVVRIPLEPGYSTAFILERITQRPA